MSDSAGATEQQFEDRKDELWEDLLTAYAAGFKHGVESVEETHEIGTVRQAKNSKQIRESHWYFWDGRTPETERWLREHFNVDQEADQDE